MESTSLNSLRVFRLAAWIWLFYSTTLAVIDAFIYPSQSLFSPIFQYHVFNGIPVLIFLVISYSGYFKKHTKVASPTLILLITGTPILTNNLLDMHLPPAPLSNIEGMVLRQLPVLLIGLVLVAWHYDLKTMVLYSLVSNIAEFGVVYFLGLMVGERMTAFSFIILIRSVSFVVVGVFINQSRRLPPMCSPPSPSIGIRFLRSRSRRLAHQMSEFHRESDNTLARSRYVVK